LVSVGIYDALTTVEGIRRGKDARLRELRFSPARRYAFCPPFTASA